MQQSSPAQMVEVNLVGFLSGSFLTEEEVL